MFPPSSMSLVGYLAPSCRTCMRSSRSAALLTLSAGPSSYTAPRSRRWGRFEGSGQQQQQRFQSADARSIRVKDRRSLFLHPLKGSSGQYALSFLPEPPLFESSPTVLGLNEGESVTPRTFEENPDGRRMIHEILRNVYTQDATLQTMAVNRGEGFLHIIGRLAM